MFERRIGLREPARLRLQQRVRELELILLHPRQNVVAGSVEDSGDRIDPVAGQAALQRSDDRDAAADAGLESDAYVMRPRGRKQLAAGFCEQRLVRSDHVMSIPEGPPDKGASRMHAADELDDDVATIVEDVDRRGCE